MHWERIEDAILVTEELALERLARARVKVSVEAQDLLEPPSAAAEVGVDVGELGLVPAGAEPEDQPSAAQLVDGRGLLRHRERVAHEDDDHARDQLQALGLAGEVPERDQR